MDDYIEDIIYLLRKGRYRSAQLCLDALIVYRLHKGLPINAI